MIKKLLLLSSVAAGMLFASNLCQIYSDTPLAAQGFIQNGVWNKVIGSNDIIGKLNGNTITLSCNSGPCIQKEGVNLSYTPDFPKVNYISNIPNTNGDTIVLSQQSYKSGFIQNPNIKNIIFSAKNGKQYFDVLTIQNLQNATLTFNPGNYYFNELNINGNNINIKTNGGPVRIFIKNGDFKINGNINENGKPQNLFIYVGGNVLVNHPSTIINGYIYAKEGDFNINNYLKELKGGIIAHNINMNNNGLFEEVKDADLSALLNCNSDNNTQTNNGNVISFNNISQKGNYKFEITDPNLPNQITTKIAGKPFNLLVKTNYKGPITLLIKTNDGLLPVNSKENGNVVNTSDYTIQIDNTKKNNLIKNIKINGASRNVNFTLLYLKGFNYDLYKSLADKTNLPVSIRKEYVFYKEPKRHNHGRIKGPNFGIREYTKITDINLGNYPTAPYYLYLLNQIQEGIYLGKNYNNNNVYLFKFKNHWGRFGFGFEFTNDSDWQLTKFFGVSPTVLNSLPQSVKNALSACSPIKTVRVKEEYRFRIPRHGRINVTNNNYRIVETNTNVQKCINALFNTPFVAKTQSQDNFAVRPYAFLIKSPKIVKAGNVFSYEVEAINYEGKVIKNFNENKLKPDFQFVKVPDNANKYLTYPLYENLAVKNGVGYFRGFEFNEVGNVKIGVKESAPYAKVDENDVSETPSKLYIPVIYGKTLFIPAGYIISGISSGYYKSLDGKTITVSFAPLSNDLTKAGDEVRIKIQGINAEGNVVKYLDQRYWQPKYIVLTVFMNSLPVNGYYKFDNGIIKTFYRKNPVLTDKEKVNFSNGVGYVNLYFNFVRKYDKPVAPFKPSFKYVKISDGYNVAVSSQLKNDIEFRYLRFYVPNLVTSYLKAVPFYGYYQYWNGNNWVGANINTNLVEAYRVPINNYYLGLVDIEYGIPSWTKNGKEMFLLNINDNIKPLSFIIHWNIPKWLFYNSLDNAEIYDFNANSCLYHPCNVVNVVNGTINASKTSKKNKPSVTSSKVRRFNY